MGLFLFKTSLCQDVARKMALFWVTAIKLSQLYHLLFFSAFTHQYSLALTFPQVVKSVRIWNDEFGNSIKFYFDYSIFSDLVIAFLEQSMIPCSVLQ
jgi:hypothetical protein